MAISNNPAWIEALDRAPGLSELRPVRAARGIMLTLTLAVAMLLVWAGVTPVNVVASSYGQVMPSGHVQVIQHLEGGIVQQILVREGERVKKDQILVVMNPTSVQSDLNQLKQELLGKQMERERTQAYLEQRAPDFKRIPGVDAAMLADQARAFESSQRANEGEAEVIRAQIAQRREALRTLQVRAGTLSKNLAIANEGLAIKQKLYEKGYYSRLNYLDKQEEVNSMRGEQAAVGQEIQRTKSEIAEYESRLNSLDATSREHSYGDLTRLNSEIAKSEEALAKFNDRAARLNVRAPVDGIVKGIEVNTVGGIVGPGQKLMEIVPLNAALHVEARIRPADVGQLHSGLPVTVKVHAFDYTRYGTVDGTLESISASTFVDESNQNYYRGMVNLSKAYVGDNPAANQLVPGMTVNAEIISGQRSLLSYLLKPVRTAADTAFTEK